MRIKVLFASPKLETIGTGLLLANHHLTIDTLQQGTSPLDETHNGRNLHRPVCHGVPPLAHS